MTILNELEWFDHYFYNTKNLCNAYLFSSADTDKLTFGTPFSGNLKVILAATSETGIPAQLVSGRQGAFTASTDPLYDPQWVQYEADVTSLAELVDETFNGVVAKYAKDNVWYNVDMGVPAFYALLGESYTTATFTPITIQNTDIISFHLTAHIDPNTTVELLSGGATLRALSGGRIQLITDAPAYRTAVIGSVLSEQGAHYIEVRMRSSGIDVWVDGVLAGSANGTVDTSTFSSIAPIDGVGIYQVTLGYQSSYPMLSTDYSVNTEDLIGGNDLTYNGLVDPLTNVNFVEVPQ